MKGSRIPWPPKHEGTQKTIWKIPAQKKPIARISATVLPPTILLEAHLATCEHDAASHDGTANDAVHAAADDAAVVNDLATANDTAADDTAAAT